MPLLRGALEDNVLRKSEYYAVDDVFFIYWRLYGIDERGRSGVLYGLLSGLQV